MMPELFLYFEDRDMNTSRMQLHTADFIYPAELSPILATLVSAIEGISDAIFIKAQFVRITKNDAYEDGTGTGIAEKTGLLITTDTASNVVTITLPSPKYTIWADTGTMAGIVASATVHVAIRDAIALFNPVSEYNLSLDTESIIVVRAV